MNRRNALMSLVTVIAAAAGVSCHTVSNANRADAAELASEKSVVFVRPDRYSVLGTRSIRDYVEVTYDRAVRTETGLLKAEVGFRNRGGQHTYDVRGPDFSISVKVAFYREPVIGSNVRGAPLYETNWQTVTLVRGDTVHYNAICPQPGAQSYQVTVSELLSDRERK
jgi:hypothetical protein